MPASKSKDFTIEEQEIALLGRALAHPARVRILSLLSERVSTRNVDLIPILRLSKTTVQNHIKKLEEADLVRIDFFLNSHVISKTACANRKMTKYYEQINS